MPEDYYADAAPPEPSMPSQESEPTEGESSDSQTAVLPKAILAGKEFKPGEEVVLEIVQVNEDSVVVKYAESGSGEEYSAPEEQPAPAASPSPMGAMME